MECKKCKAPGSVILRKRDAYCVQCFITNTNHRFRSCIGKNRVLSSNEKVLLAVSGGISSTVLLDLVHEGITLNTHKILRVNPVCVHVIGLEESYEDNLDVAEAIIKQCRKYEFDVYIVPLSGYTENQPIRLEKNCIPSTTKEALEKFNNKWKKHSSTSWNDLTVKLKRNITLRVANAVQCNYIFTAETTTTLASSLLSNLAMGRGCQIEHDIGFSDSRDDHVRILRPMKDITQEELNHYASCKKITYVPKNKALDNSLQSLVQTFVIDLQQNFPATISTVCKTSEKIGTYGQAANCNKCSFCQSDINVKNSKLTALEATNFSQALCYGKSPDAEDLDRNSQSREDITAIYCYACKRNQGLLL